MTKTEMPILPVITTLREQTNGDKFAEDVAFGLSQNPKRLSSKYFYDERGSRLFEDIMKLPEYYLTNCEQEIFDTYKDNFLHILSDKPFCLVDLGAGDAAKTNTLLKHFTEEGADFQYVPIDISKEITEELITKINRDYPALKTEGVVGEYFEGLNWLKQNIQTRKLVLFMGSNIGNFDAATVKDFLGKMWNALEKDDYLLIGFDLKKNPATILAAYDDRQGITAAFNYNLLMRINTELGGDFQLDKWKHYASYNPISGAVESFLVSVATQKAHIQKLNQTFHFDAFEAIHTEYSYKYSLREIETLCKESNFTPIKNFYSDNGYFVDVIWKK